MKTAGRLFYLSLFALWTPPSSCSSQECVISPKSIVDDACASFATLEKLNGNVKPSLDNLVRSTDFFSYYRLNLFNKRCPFWDEENGICGNVGCAVETLDNEDDIPEVWRTSELSKLEGPHAKHPGRTAQRQHPDRPLQGELGDGVGESCVFEYDDECDERDYCVPEDESASSKGDYVSLLRNPERFTGYSGEGAKQVWDAIYRENCFQKSSFPRSADLGVSVWPAGPAALDFKHVMDAAGRHAQLQAQRLQNPEVPFVANTGFEVDDECLEKRVFYRVVSGMHASISAHLCWDFLNKTTGQWQPNLACYVSRFEGHADRVSNLYFNYALVTRAVAKLGPYLRDGKYTFCTGDPAEDQATRAKVLEVTQRAASVPHIFDESLMFVNGEGPSLKEDFRNRFRNISRLMDCVGCDKCRLWGKIQTNGYGTALKVLFEFDNERELPVLKRTELVALFNTYARLSESLRVVGEFGRMLKRQDGEAGDAVSPNPDPVEKAKAKEKTETEAETDTKPKPAPKGRADGYEEDEAVREFVALRLRGPKSDSLYHHFSFELERFRAAVKIVVSGWLRAPRTFWNIITSETLRLYQFWVGLPVNPRQWTVAFPDINRNEL
ncbi:endoplasmic oxidoreductin-1 [Purpureocillium takamizusanense]|uniref:Endoplasmic oxidoreductin-1 n=1 Tax=Purpureocillium takamizusanense TaxID=2060973 RepID=A0A9Q8QQM5_9HYPO|nr:endoplasmic oxidoreductin-1 [Purpureocillium takamizusanense]UNI23086.1 endoplasmic oxidoreductin-1 [Purpureocillium takamizusanense]